jgi:hypothetical protein
MKFACIPIRSFVVSAWMAMLVATPLCAPTALFAAPPVKVAQARRTHCPCGKHCHCLVCCCTKTPPTQKQPAPVKSEARELGLFDAVATFVSLPPVTIGHELQFAFLSLARTDHPGQTLVSQSICLRV